MTELLFLAVEEAIPADHPVALLAIPIGLLFLGGSVYLLLWSNYGARKAGAIYGVAFFGFAFLIGLFWWLGGPGIPQGLGVSHLPGQGAGHYQARWFSFEEDSERASFFEGATELDEYESVEEYAGVGDLSEEDLESEPAYGELSGLAQSASQDMMEQFLPVDENGVAQIGVSRRQGFEEDAAAQEPEEADGRAQPFYSAQPVGDPMLREDPGTGVLLVTQEFQAYATFVDEESIPLDPVPVGEPTNWFAYHDPGAVWLPSMLWTVASLILFALSLLWLDRLEMRDKRLAAVDAEQPERIAEPIAQ